LAEYALPAEASMTARQRDKPSDPERGIMAIVWIGVALRVFCTNATFAKQITVHSIGIDFFA
jgi:hypothetical protein